MQALSLFPENPSRNSSAGWMRTYMPVKSLKACQVYVLAAEGVESLVINGAPAVRIFAGCFSRLAGNF